MKFKPIYFFYLSVIIFINNVCFAQDKSSIIALKEYLLVHSERDSALAIKKTKLFIKESRINQNAIDEYEGYMLLKNIYLSNSDANNALRVCDSLILIADENNLTEELFNAYQIKVSTLFHTKGYKDTEILENLFSALNISRNAENKYWEANCLNDIADFYMVSEDNDKAKYYLRKSINLLTTEKEDAYVENQNFDIIVPYQNLTQIYTKERKIDSAKYISNKIKPLLKYRSYIDKVRNYVYFINRANINLLEKNYVHCKINVDSAFSIKGLIFPYGADTFTRNYFDSKIEFEKENYQGVVSLLKKVPESYMKESKEQSKELYDYYKLLSYSYMYMGDFEKSKLYLEEHLKSISRKNRLSNSIKQKFKAIEIQEYKKLNEAIEKKEKKNKHYFLLVTGALIIGIIGLLLYFKKLKKTNKLKFNTLIHKIDELEKETSQKIILSTKKQSIKLAEVERILKALQKFVDREQYLDTDCTLALTAKKLKTNTSYLSQVINSQFHKSFNVFINELRINYALNRLKNDKIFRRYSILSIANELGYKSKDSFNKSFRNQTGILPSYYIKQLENI